MRLVHIQQYRRGVAGEVSKAIEWIEDAQLSVGDLMYLEPPTDPRLKSWHIDVRSDAGSVYAALERLKATLTGDREYSQSLRRPTTT